jgi:hypothetical protein
MTSGEKEVVAASASDSPDRRIALLCLLCGIPVDLIVSHFAGDGRGRAAGLCVAVDAVVVVLRRNSRGKLAFWLALLLIVLVQTVVIVLVPFGDQSLPAYGLLPAALVIYLFDEGIIYLFGARSAGKHPQSSATN